jgi:hypothetical protein
LSDTTFFFFGAAFLTDFSTAIKQERAGENPPPMDHKPSVRTVKVKVVVVSSLGRGLLGRRLLLLGLLVCTDERAASENARRKASEPTVAAVEVAALVIRPGSLGLGLLSRRLLLRLLVCTNRSSACTSTGALGKLTIIVIVRRLGLLLGGGRLGSDLGDGLGGRLLRLLLLGRVVCGGGESRVRLTSKW